MKTIELNLQVIFGKYDCCAYTSITLPEDYTMNQVIQAVKDRNYKKFRIVDNPKMKFVTIHY